MNWYAYAYGNPLVYADPYGLWPCWPEALSALQTALDVAGLIPGLGEPLDLVNAGISAARGNWGEAGLGVVAAVPVLGWAGTAGNGAVKYSDDAAALIGLAKQAKRRGGLHP